MRHHVSTRGSIKYMAANMKQSQSTRTRILSRFLPATYRRIKPMWPLRITCNRYSNYLLVHTVYCTNHKIMVVMLKVVHQLSLGILTIYNPELFTQAGIRSARSRLWLWSIMTIYILPLWGIFRSSHWFCVATTNNRVAKRAKETRDLRSSNEFQTFVVSMMEYRRSGICGPVSVAADVAQRNLWTLHSRL